MRQKLKAMSCKKQSENKREILRQRKVTASRQSKATAQQNKHWQESLKAKGLRLSKGMVEPKPAMVVVFYLVEPRRDMV